jgi:Peptidase inhibitor I9
MRLFGRSVAIAAAVAAIAAAPAQAASDYVVTLSPPEGRTCDSTILDVISDFNVAPSNVYTSALCGFAAPLSKSQIRGLQSDPRVASVEADKGFGAQ